MSRPVLLFDCDGVLADTERDGHRVAFNKMFQEMGVAITWDDATYAELLLVGGGKERMLHYLTPERAAALGIGGDDAERAEIVAKWHVAKSRIFRELVAEGAIPPRPGVARLINQALQDGWGVAVASTSAQESVEAVLASVVGADVAVSVPVFAGDVVARKKPAPDIYLHAVEEMGADPANTVVVEDSDVGCRAAVAAGLPVLVTVSEYTSQQDFAGAAIVAAGLGEPGAPARILADPLGLTGTGGLVAGTALLADIIAAHGRR